MICGATVFHGESDRGLAKNTASQAFSPREHRGHARKWNTHLLVFKLQGSSLMLLQRKLAGPTVVDFIHKKLQQPSSWGCGCKATPTLPTNSISDGHDHAMEDSR